MSLTQLCPCDLFLAPFRNTQARSHLVEGRSPETNLWVDDSMLTYTPLLAKHCTDECFNYKLTHFEPRLFIATIRSPGWNILFILGGADQPARRDVQAGILKTKILCLAVALDRRLEKRWHWRHSGACESACACVTERWGVWGRWEVFSGGLLLQCGE